MTVHAQCGCRSDGIRGGRWMRAHLGAGVGRHRGGVERRVLDGVAHPEHVLLAHRLDVEQGAAVVEVEFAVPAVVDGVAEIHELRRGADVELQALEDGGHVVALVVQRLLHAPGVDRAGARPLLDGDLHHLVAAERAECTRPSRNGRSAGRSAAVRGPGRPVAHGTIAHIARGCSRYKNRLDYVIKSTMSIAAGQTPGRSVSPTRRTSAPRKRGDDTRAKIIDETVRCITGGRIRRRHRQARGRTRGRDVGRHPVPLRGSQRPADGCRRRRSGQTDREPVVGRRQRTTAARAHRGRRRHRVELLQQPDVDGGLRNPAGYPRRPGPVLAASPAGNELRDRPARPADHRRIRRMLVWPK